MYTQFFGNYLLSNNYVTQEQLFAAMKKQASEHMKLGTRAIHAGLMTADEVDKVVLAQTQQDKKFGELAIELGYLSNEEVIDLLKTLTPKFLLLGQILVDEGIISNADLVNIITDYRSKNELFELDITQDDHDTVDRMFDNFFLMSETPISPLGRMYFELLFNNFIRFIGEDFTPLDAHTCTQFPIDCCASQVVLGDYSIRSYISMDESTAISFASRYAKEEFVQFDEYVRAAMQDFLNLHNGLYIVNVSNEVALELTISAPEEIIVPVLNLSNNAFHLPLLTSFGTVNLIFEIIKSNI